MNDKKLLLMLKRDEPAALEEAIHIYSGYVMAVLTRTMGTWGMPEDREELLSDVFVALWKNRHKLRDDSSLKFWLAVVARNAALQHLKRFRACVPLEENLLSEEEADVYQITEKEERASLVRQAVDSLAEDERDIFLRHYFWKQTVSVISEQTGINGSTIKSKLARGRKKLKAFLVKEDCTL